MKSRLAMALGALLLVGVSATTAYAHDDGKGSSHPPGQAAQAHEFENVVASNADEDSNAPQRYAPCINGMAADTYPCDGVDMLSHLTLKELGLSFASDMWGWTDPATGKEYALVGGIEGTTFVDITDGKRPDVVGMLPTHSTKDNPFWRDIKVYQNHAFIVSEHTDHGMQVFDLTELRGVTGEPVTFEETAHYDEISNTHNININTDTGYAYLIGTNTCEGGLHMVDVRNPTDPTYAGCFSDHGYVHDTQCVVYQGPDSEYTGREICFSSAAEYVGDADPDDYQNTVSIVDVTNKSNPKPISRFEYSNDGYSHQGWLTPDQAYFLHGDELDEISGEASKTTTRIWDVRDLDDPKVIGLHRNGTTSIDHNIYTEGDRAFASNYTTGLRVFDTSEVAQGELTEVGFFDLYPENDNATFEGGTWSNYPYYSERKVAVSSIDRGLFVLQPRGNVGS